MPILQAAIENYGDTWPSVVARSEGLRAPMSVEIDPALYPTQKLFRPGFFIGTHTAATATRPAYYRILPRTRCTGAASGNDVPVTPGTAGIFRAGDAITLIVEATGAAGAAVGTVASVDPVNNRITFAAAPLGAAANVAIGIATSLPTIAPTVNGVVVTTRLGMLSPNTVIDVGAIRPGTQFGAFTEGTFFASRLAYLDIQLRDLFDRMMIFV